MKLIALVLAMTPIVVMLGGCDWFQKEPQPLTFITKIETPDIPDECRSKDPAWIDVPAGNLRLSDMQQKVPPIINANKAAFEKVQSKRAVCRAGLKASDKPQPEVRG